MTEKPARRKTTLGLLGAIVVALVAMLSIGQATPTATAQAQVGGPVILGGDDLTDHGELDDAGRPALGWLYLQKALQNISPRVRRANDGSVAALGSAPSDETSGDAGAAIGRAAAAAGRPVTYHEGPDALRSFFSALEAGTARPRIVWISGTGASNDLDGAEIDILNENATKLADFVNQGGGLMSHGSEYGWLSALLPGLSAEFSGSSDDLVLTADGRAAFPGLTSTDINAGPWHNHFEGNFGGLKVLVESTDIRDEQTGKNAAVVIGGAAVQLPGRISLDPPSATNPVGGEHTVTATVRNNDGSTLAGELVTFAVISGPNDGAQGEDTTDSNGQATFTYDDLGGAGLDTIEASFVDESGTRRTARATKQWGTPPPPPPAEPPPPPPALIADVNVVIKQEVLPGVFGLQLRPAAAAVPPGTRMRYLLTITNNGPAPASNVALTHTAPAGASFQSVSTDTGSCAGGGATLVCSLGTLAVGQQAHVQDVAAVGQSGAATTNATVSASEVDPTAANNSASATVDVDAQPPPPPPPPALPGTADGVPNANQTVVVQELSGRVRVRLPGTNRFVELSSLDLRELPNGTLVDATGGRFLLITAAAGGQNDHAEFFEGAATVSQRAPAVARSAAGTAVPGVTELGLGLGDFGRPCTTALAKAKPKAKKKAKKKRQTFGVAQAKPVKPVRRLWGSGSGKYRTRGRFSSATVRGTIWLTEDYCNGTLVRVREGSVTVRDLVKNRTVVVTAGRSYFAEAPAPKAAKAKAKKAKKTRGAARTQR